MLHRPSNRWLSFAEGSCWTLGVVLLSATAAIHLAGAAGARHELARFDAIQAASQPGADTPDQSLWSAARIKGWQTAMSDRAPAPLGVLRIRRLRIEAPLLAGTDEMTLNRGVGHIEDTAGPGADGNMGIAGHRDGFFRGLKDIEAGDTIELQSLTGSDTYRVERTWIVEPDDVSVLDPTPSRSLTLVTCYPFYFVGSAPQRFVVRARSVSRTQP